jgi:acyl-CoA thioesterase I
MTITLPTEPITWLFLGDSITHGCVHTADERSYVEHFNEVVRGEANRKTDVLVNTAVSGWRVGDVLGSFDHYAGRFSADVAFVMYGTNDATAGVDGVAGYRAGLEELVSRLERENTRVVLQVPPPIHAPESGRHEIGRYREVVREVAADKGLLLVDHEADWAEGPWDDARSELLADHIHPNAEGHRRMARAVLRTVGLDGQEL